MENKEIQEIRMKAYFIDSAKAIIRGEGIKALSVRNVAKDAGYSYATLYNYFHNLQDLITFSLKDFIQESKVFVNNNTRITESPFENILSKSKSLSNYFIQYPGIFEVLFLESFPQDNKSELLTKEINQLFSEIFLNNLKEIYNEESIGTKLDLLKSVIIGLLILYLRRHDPKDYNEFIQIQKKLINSIF